MIEKHFEIGVKKIERKLEEPYVRYNKDGDPVDFTWDELADAFNEELLEEGLDEDEGYINGESLRCQVKSERSERGMLISREDALTLEKQQNYKERLKLREENKFLNATLKKMAGKEMFVEMVAEISSNLTGGVKLKTPKTILRNSKRSGVLIISDWHYGMVIDSFINKYNKEVFKERIQKLTDSVIVEILKHQLEVLYIANLNDLISGIIHENIRLQNSEDVIEQLMIVTDALTQMIQTFSEYTLVEYHDCIDNHSRVIPEKKLALNKENFAVLIPYTLRKSFAENRRVNIVSNEFDNEIITFEIYGFNYIGVHGHNDTVNSMVSDMSLMTKRFYNVAFLGHRHHFSADEQHKTFVYANGSLSGVDEFSKNLRLTSNPTQTLIIVSPEDCAEYVRTIKL